MTEFKSHSQVSAYNVYMDVKDKPTILVDFEDAFTTHTGIPTSLVNDVACLIEMNFKVILWISKKKDCHEIIKWIDKTFKGELIQNISIDRTRPSNIKMWLAQIFPYPHKRKIACEYVFCTLFPKLPIQGKPKIVLRAFDPFGESSSIPKVLIESIRQGDSLKNSLARTLRTYSYKLLDKSRLIIVFISKWTQAEWNLIYRDFHTFQKVVYPAVQFATFDYFFGDNLNLKSNRKEELIFGGCKVTRPYFTIIGGQRQRKDPLSVISLWAARISEYEFNLTVVGNIDRKLLTNEILQAEIAGRLSFVKNLEVEELKSLVTNSKGVLFNSHGEGFGYPIAEAMYLAVPVICNKLEVFREVAGDYASYYETDDINQCLEILTRICIEATDQKRSKSNHYLFETNIESWKKVFNFDFEGR